MTQSDIASRDKLRVIAQRAMIERGLLPDFSPAVLAETEAIVTAAAETDPSIRDLRDLLWCSIDNDDSRDLDQLTAVEPRAGGPVKILVAVADVDALVKEGSAIDGHARTNTTSVYTAAEIFPMLPEKLSTDLTSLGEGQGRLAIVIEMVVAADGAVGGVRRLSRGRAESREARLQRRRRLARRRGARAAAAGRGSGARRAAPHPGPGRPGDEEPAAPARRAEPGDARDAGRVRRRRARPTCGPTRRIGPRS